ncbi:MAG TPA: hypothetical protein ENG42_01670 [Candidatus Aenigmarchaeota archaeon]|nr:hypothetical protein [Candidatus Aenigmarchaeota archaeon]
MGILRIEFKEGTFSTIGSMSNQAVFLIESMQGPYNSNAMKEYTNPRFYDIPKHNGFYRKKMLEDLPQSERAKLNQLFCRESNSPSTIEQLARARFTRYKRVSNRHKEMFHNLLWTKIGDENRYEDYNNDVSKIHEIDNFKDDKKTERYKNVGIFGDVAGIYVARARKDISDIIKLDSGDIVEFYGEMESFGRGFSEDEAIESAIRGLERKTRAMVLTDKRDTKVFSIRELERNDEKFLHPYLFFNCISPIFPEEKIEWVEGIDMFDGSSCLIPANVVYYFLLPIDNVFNPFYNNTLGLAASRQSKEDAIKSGLYDLVENDVFVTKIFGLRIKNESLPEDIKDILNELRERYINVTFNLYASDMPPYYIEAVANVGYYKILGIAYNPDPEKAVRDALSEAIMPYIVFEDQFKMEIKKSGGAENNTSEGSRALVDFQTLKPLRDDIDHVLSSLERKEMPTYYYSIEDGEDGWYVFKMVSPFLSYPAGHS